MYISARIGLRTPRITAHTGAVASGMKYYYYYYYYYYFIIITIFHKTI
jgi:hypothetical protein